MIGTVRTFKGQPYRVVATFERRRVNGTLASIAVWASSCAECGAHFEFSRPAKAEKFEPNRRCAAHKRPGQRVKGGKV